MSEVIYLDTNVFLDYFMGQRGSHTAYKILTRSLKCEFRIVISDWVLNELKHYASPQQTKMFFNSLSKRDKIVKVSAEEKDFKEAKKISEHFQDPLHAILANKAGAKKMVTRNIQDYRDCRHLVEIIFPENI